VFYISKYLDNFINLIFPKFSDGSLTLNKYINKESLFESKDFFRKLDREEKEVFENIYVAFKYDKYLNKLIERIKLGYEWDIANELSENFYERIWNETDYFIPNPDIITVVAKDKKRFKKRGFDFPTILATNLCTKLQSEEIISHQISFINKLSTTYQQSSISKEERKINLEGRLEIRNDFSTKEIEIISKSEIIWIVDDVISTGTTLFENARLIKKEFPHLQIFGLVLSGN
jgi:predicted amidophosphoribosyltransferase